MTSIFSALVDFITGKVSETLKPIGPKSARDFLGVQTFVVGRFLGIEKSLMLVFEDMVCGFIFIIIIIIYFIYFIYLIYFIYFISS